VTKGNPTKKNKVPLLGRKCRPGFSALVQNKTRLGKNPFGSNSKRGTVPGEREEKVRCDHENATGNWIGEVTKKTGDEGVAEETHRSRKKRQALRRRQPVGRPGS